MHLGPPTQTARALQLLVEKAWMLRVSISPTVTTGRTVPLSGRYDRREEASQAVAILQDLQGIKIR
jgi:pyruvate kinase